MILASSPHFSSPVTTRRLMANVLLALAPVTVFGIYLYGWPALLTIVVSVAAALASDAGFRLLIGQKPRIDDLSAAVSGLLLALVLPPSTPLWMTALGSIFAVVVAKEFFGGIGANVFNPALIGRAFLIMSFPAAITTWHKPVGFSAALTDAVTTATPLNIIKLGGTMADVGKSFVASGVASSTDYTSVLKTLFIGTRSGCIGESSILLILIGGIFLILTRTMDWRAPVSMIATAFVASWALGMDPVFGVLSGGLVFGAVFMATDYVTAPLTAQGKLIFGFGAGLITVLIRKWGGYPEGTSYGILIMNAATPFLNRLIQKKYGFVAPQKGASK
ncbi:MAG: RnfABCDGE type electron transport complex subunit D [Treponema sp.]|nr:RnfABCDGE type electron transport complex subunit D [Treponema sp.]